jgi:hypothetical protein
MTPKSTHKTRGLILASGALCCALALASFGAHAQAWLPEKGAFSLSLDYTSILNKKHFTSTGHEIDAGHTDLRITTIAASYSPSDRIEVNASLPFVTSRYRGPGLGGHDTENDNGLWHATITDLQLSVHFQVADGPIGFAPYIGVIMPTHDYTTFGHSAPGRELDEYWLGFYTAASLNEWIPRTYVQVRYNYAFVERVQDIAHDRSNLGLEIGYFLNQDISFRAIGSWQWTHGGINVPLPQTDPLFPNHDRLADEEFFNVGAGTTWNITDRISVSGLYMQGLNGRNAHKVENRFSLGMTYDLGGH